jgi:DNA-binding CsgD family transcriptional regulator
MAAIVGRAGELAEIDRTLADVRAGTGRLMLVSGPAGIGKSRLADAAAEHAARLGMTVSAGYAIDDPGAPPMWPWSRVLRGWPGAGAVLETGVGSGEPDPAARFRLFVAVAERLSAAAGDAGLLVVLEDMHWADLLSVLLLRHLAAEIGRQRLGVLVTFRAAVECPLHDALPDLVRGDVARPLTVPALTAADVTQWLPMLTGVSDDVLAASLHARTGGNPLLVRLLAEEVTGHGDGHGPEGFARLLGERPQLRRLVTAKLEPLSSDARALIGAASILGERLAPELLADVVGEPIERVAALLDEAAAVGVVTATAAELQFTHALVRDAAYAELPPARRAQLHRRAARALEASGLPGTAGSIAHHWHRTPGPDAVEQCRVWAERADDHARAVLAYEDAARFAQLAVDCARRTGRAGVQLAEQLLRLAEAQSLASDVTASVTACTEAADLAAALGRADLLARAALVVHGTGNAEAVSVMAVLCERALGMLPAGELATRSRLKSQLVVGLAYTPAGPPPADLAAEALAEARASGDPTAVLEALAARHLAIAVPQQVEERLELGREAVALGSAGAHPIAALWGHLWRVDAAYQLGNLAEVDRELAEIDRIARVQRSPLARWHHHRYSAVGHVLAGRFDEARARDEAAGELARRLGDFSMVAMHFAFAVELALTCGAPELVPDGWEAALAQAPPIALVRVAYPIVHAIEGRLDEARAEFAEFRQLPATLPVGTRWAATLIQIARLADLLDDGEVAAALYERLAPLAVYYGGDGSGGVFSQGAMARVVGDVARVGGDLDAAIGHYQDAVAMNERIGARPFTALSRLGWARALMSRDAAGTQGGHDLDRAAELLAAAAAEFRRLGMPGPLRRADLLLGDLARARRAASPLSTREAEVAALVAQALSNRDIAARLFLSERTVESHVRSILGKLGFTTRTEIATWAVRADQESATIGT